MSSIEEADLLMELMQVLNKPYCLSMSLDEKTGSFRLEGETWQQLASKIEQHSRRPQVVMINCSPAEMVSKNLMELKKVLPAGILVGCYPNNFSWTQKEKYNPEYSVADKRTDMTP